MAEAGQAAPPAPPGSPPAATTYRDSGAGGAGHTVQVSRNVPPKRVQVVPGREVVYGGRLYTSDDEPFLIGEGATADSLAFDGHVVVTSHEEIDAWNGKEGDETRKRALAWVKASEATFQARDSHAAFMNGEADVHAYAKALTDAHAGVELTHDHGFAKYQHGDGEGAIPVDVTQHRQQVAQRHMIEGRKAEDSDFGGKPSKGGSE